MINKHIGLILLFVCFVSCSVQKKQTIQIKQGIKNIPCRFYLNQSTLDNARKQLLKEIDFAIGSDTIILLESFVSVHASYFCSLYASERGIKRYHYVCNDYNKRPRTCYLKEERVSNLVISEIQLVKTDIESFIREKDSMWATPSTRYMITFATNVNGKYIFQYFSVDD